MASYLKVDYDRDPLNIEAANLGELITNGGGPLGAAAQKFGLTDVNVLEPLIRAANPHIQFFNGSRWGFSTVEFTPTHCEYTAYSVDKSQNRSGLPAEVIKRFRVPSGQVQLHSSSHSKVGRQDFPVNLESSASRKQIMSQREGQVSASTRRNLLGWDVFRNPARNSYVW